MTEFDELLPHLFDWNGEVHKPCRNGAFGHVRVVGAKTVAHLCERDAATLLDRLDAERTVAVATGQHDAGGHLAGVNRERTEENIDGLSLVPARMLPNQQTAVLHGQGGATGQNEDATGLDLDVVGHGRHRHRRQTADDLMQEAFALRTEMRNNDDGKTRIRRTPAKKAL